MLSIKTFFRTLTNGTLRPLSSLAVETQKTATKSSSKFKPLKEGDLVKCPGVGNVVLTNTLRVADPAHVRPLDAYRVLDEEGQIMRPDYKIKVSNNTLLEMFKMMVKIDVVDQILEDTQRQGRYSFYMRACCEEASHVGSAQALTMDDLIFYQYREQGVHMWRGLTLQQITDQLFANEADLGKGRQMPILYQSKELNLIATSACLATQIPQAVGAAYSLKLEGKDACAVVYFGEGAASEGDFPSALNFAATLECPVIFFCRNNGYAISTPTSEQYRGDAIAGRGIAYGMHTMRVDGNDLFAVNDATREARRICIEQQKPVLIEALTYRGGHHSTSDDSTRYRDVKEMEYFLEFDHPIRRIFKFLENRGLWNQEQDDSIRQQYRDELMHCLTVSESRKNPPMVDVLTDVFDEMPPHLIEQKEKLLEHTSKYPDHYRTNDWR